MSTSDSSEPMQVDSVQEDSFFSHIPLPSLQQLASIQVVLPMMFEHFSQKKKVSSFEYKYLDSDLRKVVESLKTPQTIEKILTKAVKKIAKALDIWMKHFESRDFSSANLEGCRIYDCNCNPNWCVWLSSGDIDYKQTADKMLSSGELSETQIFAIMCAYCLEDEIKAFDLNSLPEHSMKKMNLNRYFLIAYWIFSMKNKLHDLFAGISGSFDAAMANRCDGELAFKYFWNRLGNEDRISVAKHKISRFGTGDSTYFCQNQLFSAMTSAEHLHLLSMVPDEIIINFWFLVKSPSLVCWAWKYSKNSMTAKQFSRIVEEIFQARIGFDKDMQMLIDLWDTAPIHLKTYAAERLVNVIFSPSQFGGLLPMADCSYFDDGLTLEEAATKHSKKEYALKFLYKFLLLVNADTRRQLMLKNAIGFGVNVSDPRLMTDVISLCLPNSGDQLLYKKKIMDSPTMSEYWAKELRRRMGVENLKSQIEVYSTDVKAGQEFTKRVLQSKSLDRSNYFFNTDNWNKMSKFIDDTFHDDPTSASNLKTQLLSSLFTSSDHYTEWNEEKKVDAMMKIVEQGFTPKELAVEKRRFAQAYKSKIQKRGFWWNRFRVNCFSKLMTWCVGDGEALLKFKKSFSIDKMFHEVIYELNQSYCNDSEFHEDLLHRFDDFLNWIFPSAEEKTKYKLNRLEMLDLKEFDMFSYLLEDDHHECLPELLGWFYDVDRVPSKVFKEFKARINKAFKRSRNFFF
ncbi:uncharacterized protein LOC135842123 [Planococcus citri]|uniref:uncharacterized protein LOC135842123 n=1 Tax=Planococcus citri TaxID=170843 RepID=UPI0031F87988